MKNRIQAVGVELEGGWDAPLRDVPLVPDASVKFRDTLHSPRWTGEVHSPPLPLDQLDAFVHSHYPPHVNETCGLHVHMSFGRTLKDGRIVGMGFSYQRLMDPSYQDTMFASLAAWAETEQLVKDHPIWKRLSGTHPHCKRVFIADTQVKAERKTYEMTGAFDRHTAINYHWFRTKTVECRILPMFKTSDQAMRGIRRVVETTNRFLLQKVKRELAYKMSVAQRGEDHRILQSLV